jgi:RNA polymerase sigma factor (sigma-70 family)
VSAQNRSLEVLGGKRPVIGHPDEGELQRWATADLAALRGDLDHVLNADTGSSAGSSSGPRSPRSPSDAELLEAVRGGDVQAYGHLFERHVRAARNLARHLARSSAEADDLVSDAFAKVLDTVRAGGGPESAFRAYLLTALRHTAYDKTRRDKKLKLADDVEAVSGVEKVTTVPFHDPAVATLERSLATRAFASLPERWQTVLWQTEIEGQSASELAKLLGLTANGASALAYRAREGLKTAYLQAHLAHAPTDRCRATVAKLAAWTRGGLTKRETAQVELHLDECSTCRGMAAELADVNGTLRAVVAPLVLGAGASGYLAATAGAAKASGAVVGAGAGAELRDHVRAVARRGGLGSRGGRGRRGGPERRRPADRADGGGPAARHADGPAHPGGDLGDVVRSRHGVRRAAHRQRARRPAVRVPPFR